MKVKLTIKEYAEGLLHGDRVVLAQAITLVESNLAYDQKQANDLIGHLLHKTGKSIRIGITGAPGVGKSTFIEVFGKHITGLGKKLAVLSIDPSSQLTRGSILGDKTRMEELSKNPAAFIRPSSSGSTLGGVGNKTRESILLCEAAGYDVIIVETVGVGQSEVSVHGMVDFFLLLMLAGAGDELQGIKKGIMEMADGIAITKADGDNVLKAKEAQGEYQHALHLFAPQPSGWQPKVTTCSALENTGIEDIWKMVIHYEEIIKHSGYFETRRDQQNITWFHESFDQLIKADFQRLNTTQQTLNVLEENILTKKISATAAAHQLLQAYHEGIKGIKS